MNNALMTIKKGALKARTKIQKNSPEILLAVGLISFAGTIVAACSQTLKAEEILKDYEKSKKDIEKSKEVAEEFPEKYEYDDEVMSMDKKLLMLKTTGNMAKTYAPVIALGALSVTCILTSRNILHNRYISAVAYGNAVSTLFQEYRNRVVKEEGAIMDRHYRYGTELETIESVEVDENGKKHKTKEVVEKEGTTVNIDVNDTARFFDESNPNWDANPGFSLAFLKHVQSYCNDILKSRGHIFLNEVYDCLGFEATQQGCIIGWVDGLGDDYIDFGLYDYEKSRDFINGKSNVFLLTFNTDGIIWDKI